MKRLVWWTASAVVSVSSVALTTGLATTGSAPAAASTAAGSSGSGPVVAHQAPDLRAARPPGTRRATSSASCSINWSGYVESSNTSDTFTAVTDTFVVPTATASGSGSQFVADWVGIGGYNDNTLVQDGIQAQVRTKKHQTTVSYEAWTEHLPKPEVPLALTISAGDEVTAAVQETAAGKWLMTVTDDSTGESGDVSVNYKSSGQSAEAIEERPCLRSPCAPRDLAHLAPTPPITFGPGSYSVTAPGSPPVEQPLLDPLGTTSLTDIVMVNNTGSAVLATPSGPSTAGDAFAVADGAAIPNPPTI